ncbi:hypothetical protein Ahy_B05g076844 [Arachis hypogaea]|uniref:O-fucosyltransferase family protein n=1 Tax=Arachis hypogaea TaxID=3818 RepID=A0A444Z407_ARAHY|nr:hypothetical protein Ahy_B05g076844 [Arachis hypogaea]
MDNNKAKVDDHGEPHYAEIMNKNNNGGFIKCLIVEWNKTENLKGSSLISSQSPLLRLKILAIAAISMLMLLTSAILLEFTALSETMKPKILSLRSSHIGIFGAPERIYENNGYLMVSSNGGLNQMRAGISDMVAIASYLNVTLVVPELDNTSFWNDRSQFQDIFDVDYFIEYLRDEVKIVKELPQGMKKRIASRYLYSMPPVSWSNMSYYYKTILPRIKKHQVVHFTKTDARLANNGIPLEVQKLRCRVNYKALRFTSDIEMVGKKIVKIMRQNGPFLVLHLRYEMDMLAFSGCYQSLNEKEMEELTAMRYAYPWWKVKEIDSNLVRSIGICPLTPEETALTLKALGINPRMQIFIAAGDIYGGEKRMAPLREAFPNLMAALDYIVSIESDIFVPTYSGNMDKVVEGHRRYLGYKTTIIPNRYVLVRLIDQYRNGTISWEEFSRVVKLAHARRGGPITRSVVPLKPKLEDYFYSNPQECLPQGSS